MSAGCAGPLCFFRHAADGTHGFFGAGAFFFGAGAGFFAAFAAAFSATIFAFERSFRDRADPLGPLASGPGAGAAVVAAVRANANVFFVTSSFLASGAPPAIL